jgi:SAM-dependent methyltransferase
MQRYKVFHSHRIKITEDLLRELSFRSVLEIGAGDYSFNYMKSDSSVSWRKIDLFPPCDIICDLNSEEVTLPVKSGSFDLIICTEVLEHLLWPHRLLEEAMRVLSNRGRILLSVPNITSLTYRISWVLGHIPSCASSGNLPLELSRTGYQMPAGQRAAGHVIDFNVKRIVALIKSAGFKMVALRGSGIIWHKQLIPHWVVPVSLSSNIICVAEKKE